MIETQESNKYKSDISNYELTGQRIFHVCAACDSNTSSLDITRGKWLHEHWHNHDGSWLCKKCYLKYVANPVYSPINSPIHHAKNSPRRLQFKDIRLFLNRYPRRGICQRCHGIKGIDFKRTNIHHFQYHEDDPLRDTIELCVACHKKEHSRLKHEALKTSS